MKKSALLFLFLALSVDLMASQITADEILKKIDDNYTAKNRVAEMTMTIKGRRGTRTLKSRSWVEGDLRSFSEYLYPPREKGTKMLKDGDDLWIYSPDTDRTIKLAGHMLRRSMMGTDISYEDFMEDPVLTNTYNAFLSGKEEYDGRECYVLSLTAKTDAEVLYFRRKMWVDTERFLPLKEERYAKSGKLLKVLKVLKVERIDKRYYPVQMHFKDVLMKGEGTYFRFDKIEFNVDLDPSLFTKASLRK